MIKSYIKIAWRNLLRHKSFSFINIGGLAIGIAACLLIALYVDHELSYDSHHSKKSRIVRVTNLMHTPEKDNVNIALTPLRLASTLKQNYPDVETAVRLEPYHAIIKVDHRVFGEENVYRTDPDVINVFDYKLTAGDAASALKDEKGAVLSRELATKYFGNTEALGKNITINKELYHVTGILAEQPENSDLKIDALVKGDYAKITNWMGADFSAYTYLLFRNEPDLSRLKSKLDQISKTDIQPELNKMGATKYALEFHAEKLSDIHFNADKLGDTPKGDKMLVYVFCGLAILILLIALLNYINLSTARAAERAKEVGVRKVNGALQAGLIRQFLFESFFVTLIALLIGIGLMFAGLPLINSMMQIHISAFNTPGVLLLVSVLVLLSSLLTGIYPAFVLAGFNPVAVLKGNFKFQSKGINLRKMITIVQFVIATVMIAGAFIMNKQINFIEHREVGYDKNQLLKLSLPDDSVELLKLDAFHNELKQLSAVKGTSVQTGLAFTNNDMVKSTTTVTVNGFKREVMANYFSVDEKFIPLLNMQIVAGQNFSAGTKAQQHDYYIVNEAFLKQLGLKDPIGKSIDGFNNKGHIVGVVKNFNYASLHNPIAPLVLVCNSMKATSVLVKVAPANMQQVRDVWQKYYQDVPFNYQYMDSGFAEIYRKDATSIRLFNYFTGLSILLASMGLYGLALLIASQRKKEMGIRKVLGAAVDQLLVLLAKDFLTLIVFAALIAVPIAWYLMDKWLAFYAYHININGWLLMMPVLVILTISITVISYHTLKTALSNPVNSLKNE